MPVSLLPGQTNLSSLTIPTPGTTAPAQNKAALPDITSLLQSLNQLNIGSQGQANLARIPGEAGLESQSSANIGSELAGQLPASVMALLGQQAGERGVATGSPGSPNSNAAYLQALGLTSLAEQQQGQRDLSAAVARNPVAQLIDPTNQLLTPAQAGNLGVNASGNQLDWLNSLQRLTSPGGNVGGTTRVPAPVPPAPDTSFYQWLYGGPTAPTAPSAPTSPADSGGSVPISYGYNTDPNLWMDTTNPPVDYSNTLDSGGDLFDTGFDPSVYG